MFLQYILQVGTTDMKNKRGNLLKNLLEFFSNINIYIHFFFIVLDKQHSLHKNSEVFVQEIKRGQQELSLQQNHHLVSIYFFGKNRFAILD